MEVLIILLCMGAVGALYRWNRKFRRFADKWMEE